MSQQDSSPHLMVLNLKWRTGRGDKQWGGREFTKRRDNQKGIRSCKDKFGLGAKLEMVGGEVGSQRFLFLEALVLIVPRKKDFE